jgi:hypothetical protein
MEEKVIKEDIAEKVSETRKPIDFKYAHLCLKCSCGSDYIIDKDVKGGLRIDLPTNDLATIKLVCRDCGHEMVLYYRESNKKDTDEVVEPSKEDTTKE